ncbi:hypothetical protein EXS57_02885 [Candidatus Kaiserbacteria bacterium]|nr:hypothetical protein [Candidatus Kaiserbacteria bacterium]
MSPIKLYAPDRYREPKLFTHTELLFPFWGITAKESMPYVRAAALQYQYSKKDFALVDAIEEADFVLLPYSYERFKAANPAKVRMIVEEAHRAGKTILIDGAGDLERPINIPNSVVMRVSQYKYSKKTNEITVPFVAEDLLESYVGGALSLREKSERPIVGFTGWAQMSLKTRLKTYWKELPITIASMTDENRGAEHKGILFREKALCTLSRCTRIESRFVTRATYSGHEKTIQGAVADNRTEFIDNLLGADYALCVKGDANASVRFYEALSLGRIPLFLDTACVLPLEDKINYRDFCVFIDWQDVDRIGDILANFHARISSEGFKDMQRKARDAYVSYLRLDKFSVQLAEVLRGFST